MVFANEEGVFSDTMKKNRYKKISKRIGILVPLVLTAVCCIVMVARNAQATFPRPIPLKLIGEYSYDGSNWYPLEEDSELDALAGDLIIRGHFDREIEGVPLNYYRNHIGVSVKVNGEEIFMDSQTQVGRLGIGLMESMCGCEWNGLTIGKLTPEDELEICLVNYHTFGNATAYRDFVDTLCSSAVPDIILENFYSGYKAKAELVGGAVLTVGIMFLGAAVTARFMQNSMSGRLFVVGLLAVFAGAYIYFDTVQVMDFSDMIAANTFGRRLCAMFIYYLTGLFVVSEVTGRRKKISQIAVGVSFVINFVLLVLVIVGKILLFNTLPYWVISQWIICPVLLLCLVWEMIRQRKKEYYSALAMGAMLIAQMVDLTGIMDSMYSRGTCFKIVFVILVLLYLIGTIRRILLNSNEAIRAKQLDAELAEKRIAIMLSQIQPHFIYNTLGTIGQFCLEEPHKAADLVREFSLYLRGNFTELDNLQPIPISKEIEHVKHYVQIEQVRFPDIKVTYDLQADDFLIPSLTIQPLVENAIKHGLMGLESGGHVQISTHETSDAYFVCVKDDGVGFEMSVFNDGKKHVGIENIRGRLEAINKGNLIIDSTVGKGTIAIITIPKTEEE